MDPAAAIAAGSRYSQTAVRNLALVQRPIAAASAGTGLAPLGTAARTLGRSVTALVVGVSVLRGAGIVANGGPAALVNTQEGRSALLGGVGGVLILCPTPATQLGGAGALALAAANEFGWLGGLNRL